MKVRRPLTGLPSMTGNSGKVLGTDGVTSEWVPQASGDSFPDQTGHSGEFLKTDGSTPSWEAVPTELPTQTGHASEFLTTDGSAVSWAVPPTPTRRRILYQSFVETPWNGSTETDVNAYTLPANTLVNGKGLCIRSTFRANGDANSKTLKLYFGGTTLRTIAVASGVLYRYMETTLWSWFSTTFQEYLLVEYSVTSSNTSNNATATAAPIIVRSTAAEDITAAINIRMTVNAVNAWGRHLVVELLE